MTHSECSKLHHNMRRSERSQFIEGEKKKKGTFSDLRYRRMSTIDPMMNVQMELMPRAVFEQI